MLPAGVIEAKRGRQGPASESATKPVWMRVGRTGARSVAGMGGGRRALHGYERPPVVSVGDTMPQGSRGHLVIDSSDVELNLSNVVA